MDEHKICFVMCVNDDAYAAEAVWYIRRLKIPDGYCVEWQCVKGAVSMTAGYNEAMKNSDARYKVYLHQDVMILEPDFIERMLHIFQDPSIGMFGMVGSRKLPENGVMWYAPCVGKVYMTDVRTTRRNTLEEVRGEWCPVHHKVKSPYREPYYLVSTDGRRFRLDLDRKSTRLNSSHIEESRMPSSA